MIDTSHKCTCAEPKAAQQLPPHSCEPNIGQTEYKKELDDASCGTLSDMWNKTRESGHRRPDDSAGDVVPNSKLTSFILITDHLSNASVSCPMSLCMLTTCKHSAFISPMIQASFQTLAYGNLHHAPSLNENFPLPTPHQFETRTTRSIKFPASHTAFLEAAKQTHGAVDHLVLIIFTD